MPIELTALAARHPAAASGAPPALRPLSLAIAPGDHVAVIGPSGAGKTTLLHALACALKPASGGLTLDGADPGRCRWPGCSDCAGGFSLHRRRCRCRRGSG